ncbi:hypothetical protein JQX13_15640 [Archangium violaceum]|uniref:hypothetical protein n=1 Tax=Archangium violaceum TaxID=83451 RepID=UPI00193C5B71|nr:hypothetical protein [Archangium violaceum]QRK11375.1 hypothetical protein JQX13_15640 [Archangium violaceum]
MLEFKADCEVDGGLVVADRETLNALSDEDLFSMMVALDEQGTSELAFDYPGVSWQHVYDRETLRLRELCTAGGLWFANMGPGRFWGGVEVEQVGSTSMPDGLASGGGSLRLPSGDVVVVEAGYLCARRAYAVEEPMAEVSVRAGLYGVRFLRLPRPEGHQGIRGEWGASGRPAVVVSLWPRMDATPDLAMGAQGNLLKKDASWLSSWSRADDLVWAALKRVEGHRAIFTISFPSGHGYAEAPMGARHLSAGDEVLLRLIEKSGGRWSAEIAGP